MNVLVTSTKTHIVACRNRKLVTTTTTTTLSRRNKITWSMEPPFVPPTKTSTGSPYYERPYSIVFLESSCYNFFTGKNMYDNLTGYRSSKDHDDSSYNNNTTKYSWCQDIKDFFPSNGVHVEYMDLFSSTTTTMKKEEEENLIPQLLDEMATDLTSTSYSSVFIARGAVPSLLAQYYLESYPFKGLIMIDPCIVPTNRTVLRSTAFNYLSSTKDLSFNTIEKQIITSLATINPGQGRQLKLEKESIPMLILYESESDKDSKYGIPFPEEYLPIAKHGAEQTFLYHNNHHTTKTDSTSSNKVSWEKKTDDNFHTMKRILQFCDEI